MQPLHLLKFLPIGFKILVGGDHAISIPCLGLKATFLHEYLRIERVMPLAFLKLHPLRSHSFVGSNCAVGVLKLDFSLLGGLQRTCSN